LFSDLNELQKFKGGLTAKPKTRKVQTNSHSKKQSSQSQSKSSQKEAPDIVICHKPIDSIDSERETTDRDTKQTTKRPLVDKQTEAIAVEVKEHLINNSSKTCREASPIINSSEPQRKERDEIKSIQEQEKVFDEISSPPTKRLKETHPNTTDTSSNGSINNHSNHNLSSSSSSSSSKEENEKTEKWVNELLRHLESAPLIHFTPTQLITVQSKLALFIANLSNLLQQRK
jgi:hypothetical protein